MIGVILRKSANENLNYALPISEVLNAPPVAQYDFKPVYGIDNMDMTHTVHMQKEFALPKSCVMLDREMTAAFDRFVEQMRNGFFSEHRDQIFPNGVGSFRLLSTTQQSTDPGLIAKGADGIWNVISPQSPKVSDLGKNGYLTHGLFKDITLLRLRRPDDLSLATLLDDSKKQMDELLRGIPRYRYVGAQKVRITSFGKADRDERFADHYGRHWIAREWKLPHNDQAVILLALPVPNGFIGLMGTTATSQAAYTLDDFKALADFLNLSYFGTLEQ